MAARSISKSSFVVECNGFAEGPAQALSEYLVDKQAARLTTISHPLDAEDGSAHVITRWAQGKRIGSTHVRLPSRPPLTYPLDLTVPLWPPVADVWFGFNGTTCFRGLVAKRMGRAGCVVYWCVDFVQDRFGKGPLTRAYEWLDGLCARDADARFELSATAAAARDRRHAGRPLAPTRVVPMGSWRKRTPTTPENGWERRRLVYLGHLVPRQGVDTMLNAVAQLAGRGVQVTAEIIGRGPMEAALHRLVQERGLEQTVKFRGFIEDHRQVERLLAEGSVGLAPYLTGIDSFTQFSDPGKLKAYLGAGLPIVLTPVPPIAREIADSGAGVLVESTPESIAGAIETILASPAEWQQRRQAALTMAQRYDWDVILAEALASLGFHE